MNEEQTQEGQQQWDSWLSRPFRAKASSSMAFDQSMSRRASTSFSALWMCRQEGGVLDGRIGRGLGETPYRYFRIWSAPSVLSLRTSGYRDLLATLQEKQLEAPKSVWHSEIKRAWAYLEAGLLLRANAPCGTCCDESTTQEPESCVGCPERKVEAYAAAGINGGVIILRVDFMCNRALEYHTLILFS